MQQGRRGQDWVVLGKEGAQAGHSGQSGELERPRLQGHPDAAHRGAFLVRDQVYQTQSRPSHLTKKKTDHLSRSRILLLTDVLGEFSCYTEGRSAKGVSNSKFQLVLQQARTCNGKPESAHRLHLTRENEMKSRPHLLGWALVLGATVVSGCAPGPNIKTISVRIGIDDVYLDSRYDDTCLAEIEVWGRA